MMQDSLCGTKALIDPKAELFELDDPSLLRSPDSTWMDLMDELTEPEAMLCSPIPDRSFQQLSFDEEAAPSLSGGGGGGGGDDLSSIVGTSATPPPPSPLSVIKYIDPSGSSSSSPLEEHFGSYSFESDHPLPSQPDNSLIEASSIHKVPSAPHLESFHPTSLARNIPARNLAKTRSFCSIGSPTSRSMPDHHSSPLHHGSPSSGRSPSKKLAAFPAPPRSIEEEWMIQHDAAAMAMPLPSPSLASPLQDLLDQDPSALLRTSIVPVGGQQLLHMLLSCGEKIAQEDYNHAGSILRELQLHASPTGSSIHRVAAYFADALAARLNASGSRSFHALRAYDQASLEEILGAYHILYQVCPYIKFAHFTANQAIFEAFQDEQHVHIIDLEILQGYQWPAFMQAMAGRQKEPPHLRITGVGMPLEAVRETGKRLTDLARSLHLPFEYHAVGERLEDLRPHMLHRRSGEALAVNSIDRLHRLFGDDHIAASPLVRLLRMIREQGPTIVTMVEQEASHNTSSSSFLKRFLEAMHYYSAIFDSLEATLPQGSPERAKVEQVVFSSEITNIVACEGGQRIVRHERMERWRKIMESTGFYNVALSPSAVHQSRLLLRLYQPDGYTLVEDGGYLLLGWHDRAIIGASAWRCLDRSLE